MIGKKLHRITLELILLCWSVPSSFSPWYVDGQPVMKLARTRSFEEWKILLNVVVGGPGKQDNLPSYGFIADTALYSVICTPNQSVDITYDMILTFNFEMIRDT